MPVGTLDEPQGVRLRCLAAPSFSFCPLSFGRAKESGQQCRIHRVTLLTVGPLKSSWIKEGCEEYVSRLKHSMRLKIEELPASKLSDPAKQMEEESERLRRALEKHAAATIMLLDERGKEMTSETFAPLIGAHRDRGQQMVFLIGGAYGISDALKKNVRQHMRLSSFTLTHEMSRLILLEQLYRATEILKGSGYHH